MRKTKIICTVGPASESVQVLSKLIEGGMDASRHNFSHGDHAEHAGRINLVKELRKTYNKHIAIILDTKGPEIRTGDFNGDTELIEGTDYTVVCGEPVMGTASICSITYEKLSEDVKAGDVILIADGLVGLEVKSVSGNRISCTVKNTGVLGSHKNVNVPGVSIKLPAVTQKDIDDLIFGIEQGVDMITASFIRKAADVLDIRKVLRENGGSDILIFSKIENQEGINNIDEIIKFSDGIMVARGDLGVEIPTEDVPVVQKMIIQKCNKAGKPVITATQMLDSMIRNPRPTRAEASDVANAILDGTDAIMLSGETASGKYPVETVETMSRIARRTEMTINYEANLKKIRKNHVPNVPNSISLATCNTAMDLNASAIITATQSGHTARIVSKYRPECPIIAVTPYEKVARSLALNWGVIATIATKVNTTDELVARSADIALETGLVKKGDLVIIAAGIPVNYSGSTNMLKVHIVGEILAQGKGAGEKNGYGTAKLVTSFTKARDTLEKGEILVIKSIDNEFLSIIDRASGIIVEDENVSSDITIACIAKEIPLIYNASGAMQTIKTGSFISMDVPRGIVFSGKANLM